MTNTSLSFIMLLFLADHFLCDVIFATLCSRVFFKQPQTSDELIYKEVINGIYIKTKKVVDNFPLYLNERGSIYFQYNKDLNLFYFSKPFPGEKYYLGLGAEADRTKMNDPKSWVKKADQKNNIFGGVVTKWFQYRINKNVYLKENLNIACSNSTDCLFRDLIFNYNYSNLNDSLIDYFTPVDNLYSLNRQVYKHSKFNVTSLYLFYLDSYWIIGSNITSTLAFWAVFDQALKPEFITNTWRKYNGKKWEEQVGVTFQCRGLDKPCSDDRCTMNGVCSLNQINRTTCTCFFNFAGDDCSKKSETCKSDVEVANIEAGSIWASFCLSNDNIYDVLCARTVSGEYAWTSNESCKIPTTTARTTTARTTTSTTTTTITAIPGKIFNADDFYWINILAIVLASSLPILGPLIIWQIKDDFNYGRILSLWWYFSMVILLCFKLAAAIFSLQIYGPKFFSTMDTIAAISIPIFYLYVLIEAQFCNEKKYLDSSYEGDEIDHYLSLIYEKEPQLFIIIECYHFETRTRIITYTDANGNLQSRVETYQEKVTSFSDSKMFNFRTWRDVSDRSQVPSTRTKVTRIKLSKTFTFADQQTSNEFSNVESNFIETNRNRDAYINSYNELNITGFKERIMGIDGNRPFWMTKVCFQLANLLALSWPYRWLLGGGTQKIEHSIIKEISIIENLPPNISLAEQVIYPNQPFHSEQIGLQPYPGAFSNNQHDNLCSKPTFLNNSGTIEAIPPPPYPYDEVRY